MLRIEAPNEPKIRYCCWNSCIRLKVTVGPEVAPQVTSRPPRLSASSEPGNVSAPTCSNTTSTPFLAVILRTIVLEAVGAVIDDVIGAERLRLFRLGVVADRGDDGAADRLRHLDRDGADARAAGMDQDRLAGLELGVVEQHVLDGRRTRSARRRRRAGATPAGTLIDQPRRHVDEIAREAVDVEAHDAARRSSQRLSRPSRQALQVPQVSAPYITTGSPGARLGDAGADRGDLARGLGADDERQLALGERHAAKAPEVDDG